MTTAEKIAQRKQAILRDILENHMPRIIQGLRAGYVDENQIMVVLDHAMRCRVMEECLGDAILDAVFTDLPGTPLDLEAINRETAPTLMNGKGERHPIDCRCEPCLTEKADQKWNSQ